MVVIVAVFVLLYRTPTAPINVPSIVEFGGVSLRIEYATTTEARERGLGGRTEIQIRGV